MNAIVKNSIAVVAGVFAGSSFNMVIVMVSGSVIPPPEGADVTTMEGLKATMHLFEPRHFLFPFLAHAIGTFAGAFFAARMAVSHQMKFALSIGTFFLLGGIANTFMLPSPVWFTILDLSGGYLPMAYLGAKLANRVKAKN